MAALREDQVQRYGRQILLKELGGAGQRTLLGLVVEALGQGPALDDALAYLVASGAAAVPRGAAASGFLHGATPTALSPDADPAGRAPTLRLVAVEQACSAPVQVVVGAGVAWRTAPACDDCFAATRALIDGPTEPSAATVVGAAAALAAQRLALGWAAPLGLVRWTGERLEEQSPRPCPRHAGP